MMIPGETSKKLPGYRKILSKRNQWLCLKMRTSHELVMAMEHMTKHRILGASAIAYF